MVRADDTDDTEPLTSAQTTILAADVAAAMAAIETDLADTIDDAAPVDLESPIGRLSRMDAMQQQQMASARRRQQERRLQQLVAAHARITDGRFGVCLRCEEPIAFRRLQARPEAVLCVACQSARGA